MFSGFGVYLVLDKIESASFLKAYVMCTNLETLTCHRSFKFSGETIQEVTFSEDCIVRK